MEQIPFQFPRAGQYEYRFVHFNARDTQVTTSSGAGHVQPAVVLVRVPLFVPSHVAATQAPAAKPFARFVTVPLVSSKLLASLPSPAHPHSAAFAAALSLIWLLTSCSSVSFNGWWWTSAVLWQRIDAAPCNKFH